VLERNPAVPPHLARVVQRALDKEPSLRYASAEAMRAALGDDRPEQSAPTLIAPTMPLPAATAATQALPPRSARVPPNRSQRTIGHGKLLVALAAAALLLVAAFALATRGSGGHPRVALPHVDGMPVAAASSALRARGFAVRVASPVHAARPAGSVTAMRPSASSAVRGATITLVPSSGPRPIAIPAVGGYSQQAATAALQHAGLAVQARTAYAAAPAGTVIATTPPSGHPVPPHSSVVLTISAGPAPVIQPPDSTPGKQPPDAKPGKRKGHHKVKAQANQQQEGD
jgi:serine/threonine-protein kinase